MKQVTIYTDGACSGNPGPGGWGAILMYGAHKRELSGGETATTNNRMELTAVIQALSLLKEPCIVELWSDSKYVIDGLSKGWAKGWKTRGWVKSDKKPALNPDLWEELLRLEGIHTLHYHWVKGHAENEYNNRCDELAVAESRKFRWHRPVLNGFCTYLWKTQSKSWKIPRSFTNCSYQTHNFAKMFGYLNTCKGSSQPDAFSPS